MPFLELEVRCVYSKSEIKRLKQLCRITFSGTPEILKQLLQSYFRIKGKGQCVSSKQWSAPLSMSLSLLCINNVVSTAYKPAKAVMNPAWLKRSHFISLLIFFTWFVGKQFWILFFTLGFKEVCNRGCTMHITHKSFRISLYMQLRIEQRI